MGGAEEAGAGAKEAFLEEAAGCGFRGGEGLGDVAGVGDGEPDRHGCGGVWWAGWDLGMRDRKPENLRKWGVGFEGLRVNLRGK